MAITLALGFTSRAENVIDGNVTKISGSGAWTQKPLAWTITATYDSPESQEDLLGGDKRVELIYLGSAPFGAQSQVKYEGVRPTDWLYMPSLGALDLTQHMGELGFLNRFEGTSTRVLVTVGADGLPQTLEFAGTGIGRPEVDLPDYVIEELGGARYFAEYGKAELDGPIKAPPTG